MDMPDPLPQDLADVAVPDFEVPTPVVRRCRIAGMEFREQEGALTLTQVRSVQVGMTAFLEPEPTNPYDPYAMRVVIGGVFFGYLPKWLTREIAGKPTVRHLQATVDNLHPSDTVKGYGISLALDHPICARPI